jgi:hypothetical protein
MKSINCIINGAVKQTPPRFNRVEMTIVVNSAITFSGIAGKNLIIDDQRLALTKLPGDTFECDY